MNYMVCRQECLHSEKKCAGRSACAPKKNMSMKLKINGREIEAEPGKTVLQVALAAGIYIPHYCYHPRLTIKGSCRMCLVQIEKMPKLQISCATTVAEGMVVTTDNPEVKKAQQATLEFMLKNHPVDCPICDKAGECTLQDYYMAYDAAASRLDPKDKKVRKGKRAPMGETLVLDQERCVMCHRCIRFMAEVAQNECLTDARRTDRTLITTFPGEVVNDPYSLNLTDICPVGAWTGKDFRFRKRVWLLTKCPSICPFCARGCNTFLDHEKGTAYRLRPRENDAVNKSWLCDEGRLAYRAINENRLDRALIREGGGLKELSVEAALSQAVRLIRDFHGKVLGAVSASASLEEAESFKKLLAGLGAEVVCFRRREGKDDFLLRKADRDSNRNGMAKLGIDRPVGDAIVKAELVIALESLYSEGIAGAAGRKMVALSPKRSELVESATIALPISAYAESEGTYINSQGMAQKFYPAMRLKEDAQPGAKMIRELGKKLGVEI